MILNYKLCIVGLALILALSFTINYYKNPSWIGLPREFAEQRVEKVLADTMKNSQGRWYEKEILVKTEQSAIRIAEPILFDIYGKERILSERPYGVHKIHNYWYIAGSLSRRLLLGEVLR